MTNKLTGGLVPSQQDTNQSHQECKWSNCIWYFLELLDNVPPENKKSISLILLGLDLEVLHWSQTKFSYPVAAAYHY